MSEIKNNKQMSTKKIVVCGMCIALAYITSELKLFEMPYGGSITLFSMFFISFTGYCFGIKTGLICGFTYGIFQFIQNPWFLNVLQVCLDYIFAFTALGMSGLFRNMKKRTPSGEKVLSKKGLITGYAFAVFFRALFNTIGGYMFWMSGMPDNFPPSLKFLYPIIYNYSYSGVEAIITIAVLMIPGVSSVLIKLRHDVE